jgi:ABC-2 type transport system permease protein
MGVRGFLALLENEVLKLLRRRRPQLVLAMLTAFLAIAAWGQLRQQQNARRASGDLDWRARTEQRIGELERSANRRRVFVGFARFQRHEAERLRYHLQHGIDPNVQTGPLFARGVAVLASALMLPLLVTVLASDLVSAEVSAGTIKMLLTRPVARWRVLAAKLAAMTLFVSLLLAATALIAWLIAGALFGFAGWTAPVLTGFRSGGDGVDLSNVRMAPLWLDALATYGLAWLAALVVGAVAVTFSVLFRTTAAAMGVMVALIAAGALLPQLASDWEPMRFLFMTNLPLAQFHAGLPTPVAGMTLTQSALVLAAWGIAAVAVALIVWSRRDVTA